MKEDFSQFAEINRKAWNKRAELHYKGEFYRVEEFKEGNFTLPAPDLELLGDVSGKRLLHLQCHFGMDTLALARMGADVTGVDISDTAIEHAVQLAAECGLDARFLRADVLQLTESIREEFDIVYSSYGAIPWLDDLSRWAGVIRESLCVGGEFIFAEFHPVMWMYDNALDRIEYSYFNRKVIREVLEGTYGDKNSREQFETLSWNHDLGEVLQSLINAGLQITNFREFDYSPYDCFNNTVEVAPCRFQIRGLEGKLPMMYAMKAVKSG